MFEERVSGLRQASYEATVGAATTVELDRGHRDYLKAHIELRDCTLVPATFQASNAKALLPSLADQDFVRIEDIGWVADKWYATEAGLPAARDLLDRRRTADPGVAALLAKFIAFWNGERDGRPMFAASLDEVRAAADAADWALRLRAQLGLGHYAPLPGKSFLLAQLRYTAADVRRHALPGQIASFAAPTVMDGPMNPYFYPAPQPRPGLAGSCGRTVHLDNSDPLIAELLTARIDYRLEHIHAVAVLMEPLPATARPSSIVALRNGHLGRLRAVLGCPDFAEPMR